MGSKKTVCCYHPTTVVLIDDDEAFLDMMSLHLDREIPCITYSDPKKALHFLKDEYKADPYTTRCTKHQSDDLPLQRSIKVDITPIRNEVYNPKRYSQISVIVADQMMPGLTGLELCENLADTKFKKILLTGKAKETDVIDDFNRRVINKYISKKSDDLKNIIKKSIQELQEAYFDGLSSIVLNSLIKDSKHHPNSCLSDPKFVAFFNTLIKEYGIVEYYLIDEDGSFLLVDKEGRLSILAVKVEESMLSTYEIAKDAKHPPSDQVLEKLKNKELVLHLRSREDLQLEPAEWEKQQLLHPANVLVGNEGSYYWAYIKDLEAYPVKSKKIISFHEYLKQLG